MHGIKQNSRTQHAGTVYEVEKKPSLDTEAPGALILNLPGYWYVSVFYPSLQYLVTAANPGKDAII